ncbi:MAG: hypothetical protein AAF844_03435 [Pseudomonadota bacterium]
MMTFLRGEHDPHREAHSRATPSSGLVVLLGVSTLILAGGVLRWIDLTTDAVWGDEILVSIFAQLPVTSLLFDNPDVHPPLYVLLHKYLVAPADGAAALRTLSLVFGTLSIPAAFAFGWAIKDARCGLWAAALMAVWSLHIDYSQEGRSYAVLLLLVTLASAALAHCLALTPSERGRWYAVVAVLGALVFATHFIGIFWLGLAIFVVAIDYALSAERTVLRRPVRNALALGILLATPTALHLRLALEQRTFNWLLVPDLAEFSRVVQALLGITGFVPSLGAAVSIATALVACIGLGLLISRGRFAQALFIGGLIALPCVLFVVSQVKPVLMERTALIALPGLIVALAVALAAMPRYAATGLGVGLIAVQLSSVSLVERAGADPRGLDQGAAAFAATLSERDVVVFAHPTAFLSFKYRLGRDLGQNSLIVSPADGGLLSTREDDRNADWQTRMAGHLFLPLLGNPLRQERFAVHPTPFDHAKRSGGHVWLISDGPGWQPLGTMELGAALSRDMQPKIRAGQFLISRTNMPLDGNSTVEALPYKHQPDT